MKHSEVEKLMAQANEDYEKSLRELVKGPTRPFGFTKKTIETLLSGHRDGVRNAFRMLTTKHEGLSDLIHVEPE